MPTPDRTSLDAIVRAASGLLEEAGLSGVTMQAVAQRVGVQAPSLYKRVPGRDRLLELVAETALVDLAVRLEVQTDLAELARAMRAFGRERPAAFRLVMTPAPGTPIAHEALRAATVEPLLRITTELAGDDRALDAARTLTSWATGFISMEIDGRFRLGGDVERAWDYGLTRIVAAITEHDGAAQGESAGR